MADLTPNHPAVEAALDAEARTDGPMSRDTAHYMLEHALPRLTTDTEENLARLRNTPVGRALMAEAWEEGALHQARGSAETRRVLASALPNPYKETPTDD